MRTNKKKVNVVRYNLGDAANTGDRKHLGSFKNSFSRVHDSEQTRICKCWWCFDINIPSIGEALNNAII